MFCYYSHLQDLVSRTVVLRESNSILVVGPRGCGKSMVINFSLIYIPCWKLVFTFRQRIDRILCECLVFLFSNHCTS